ncbi:sensor histidine kinase [Hymenobacter aerophilus]|uniref:sensor histidine kinase n=1 Tax=Hymenobacter aerophilus TaxID=119644 RepID=UPI00036323C4|nr:sensor histidine kinase [Hymenobacter aerophilus]
MEVLPPPVSTASVSRRPPLWRSWQARLRGWLQPTEWSAKAETTRVPRWVHIVLWLWLLLLDGLKISNLLGKLPRFPLTVAEWQPLAPRLAGLLLEDLAAATLFYLTWRWLVPTTLGRARVVLFVPLAALLALPYIGLMGWVVPQLLPKNFDVVVHKVPPRSAGAGKPASDTSKAEPAKGFSEGVYDGYKEAEQRRKPATVTIKAGKPEKRAYPEAIMQLVATGIISGFIIAGASGLRITHDYILGQRNRRELERQQLLTELAMLKTQINPHFLFNTLNNIYSLTSRKSDKAPEAVLRLAEIMRYLLYESSTDTVPLSRELAHLRSFLDLQRLRLPASAQEAIVLEVEGSDTECAHPIAPLLLLPLVENAFKHGDLAARPVSVHIALHLAPDGQLRFSVLNHVAPADAERPLPKQPGGVGLANLRRRLALLYPNRYTLDVQTTAEQHRVTLVLLS